MNGGLQEVYFSARVSDIRRGRNITLLQRRDEKIVARFYYYSHIKKSSYKVTMEYLSAEFDISERVVLDRLRFCGEILDKVFKEKPSLSELKRRIPYMVWN